MNQNELKLQDISEKPEKRLFRTFSLFYTFLPKLMVLSNELGINT